MTTAVVTTKGQIVIPSKMRHKLHIKKGTKFYIVEKQGRLILQPLTEEYFESMAGILRTKGRLTKEIILNRRAG